MLTPEEEAKINMNMHSPILESTNACNLQCNRIPNRGQNTPPEWRENSKLIMAGILAGGTWSVLGWLICSQFQNSVSFAEKIAALPSTATAQISSIKEANDTVNKTSSSLYAFITPFATAISGYFFISSGNLMNKRENDPNGDDSKNNKKK
jgi:hypothetical protein